MPARQDSRDSHVKYHLLERKWQGVCGGVWRYVFVCVPWCALKCMCGCPCAFYALCISTHIHKHSWSTCKPILTEHWHRDQGCAQMTLEEKGEKKEKKLTA